jgi:hypothetical protein
MSGQHSTAIAYTASWSACVSSFDADSLGRDGRRLVAELADELDVAADLDEAALQNPLQRALVVRGHASLDDRGVQISGVWLHPVQKRRAEPLPPPVWEHADC